MSLVKAAIEKIKASTRGLEKKLEARVQVRISTSGTLAVTPTRMKVRNGTTIYTTGCKSSRR